jgi:chemotaxis protein histidine kinase CheA
LPTKTERVSAEGDPEELQRLVAQAVESHLRRLVVGLLELHDRPADRTALAQVRDEAQAVASALLTVDLDHLSSAARAISDTLDSLAGGTAPVPSGAVVALLDATAGLRALVAARGQPESAGRPGDSLERELAALAPWHPVTAALRAASGSGLSPSLTGEAGTAAEAGAPAGESGPEAWAAAAARRAEGAARDRLRVVPTIDFRSVADRSGASLGNAAALVDLLAGLSQLADVLVRATAALQSRLAELADLPELAELEAAVQALSQSATAAPEDRTAPPADRTAAPDRRRPSR